MLLAARPLAPQQFTLYFIEGKDEFTDESKRVLDSVMAEIAKRPVPDVLVIGHTDTVGTDAFNDVLSRQRGAPPATVGGAPFPSFRPLPLPPPAEPRARPGAPRQHRALSAGSAGARGQCGTCCGGGRM